MGEKVQFYIPKIKYKRLKKNKFETHEKTIIEDYMFCYHDKFNDIVEKNNPKQFEILKEENKNFYS